MVDEENKEVMLLVSSATEKNYKFQIIDFIDSNLVKTKFIESSYTILDTSENTVFIHVNHFGSQSKYGHIYISDPLGEKYSLSLHNNIRVNKKCDFESIKGIDGIYITNVINADWMNNAKQELQEEEMREKGSMGAVKFEYMGDKENKISAKQKMNQMMDFIETYITFNKGGLWHRLKPPETDLNGKPFPCSNSTTTHCSLHLHSVSSNAPFLYSVSSAVGIIIANGNVGEYLLEANSSGISTFMSRDAGLSWFEIRKGAHIYEIGNHGGIIVLRYSSSQRL